jgi:thiamine biosynthesis protein ThiS
MIRVNGENVDIQDILLTTYLQENGYRPELIAVECNEEIIPKADYAGYMLHDGDVVEIVSFMGGGSC